MSLILEALKKAQRDRERHQAPEAMLPRDATRRKSRTMASWPALSVAAATELKPSGRGRRLIFSVLAEISSAFIGSLILDICLLSSSIVDAITAGRLKKSPASATKSPPDHRPRFLKKSMMPLGM